MMSVSGDFFKYLRKCRGVTQSEVSDATGIPQGNIAKIENNYFKILSKNAQILLSFYGIQETSIENIIETPTYKNFIKTIEIENIHSEILSKLYDLKAEEQSSKLKLILSYMDLLIQL